MGKEFIDDADHQMTEEQVYDQCPWAAVVLAAEGGWWAWKSESDAEVWLAQK